MIYFEKTQPAPQSLAIEKNKKSGVYNQDDVLELLYRDFKNKCYICEQKAPISINIEHFKPHLSGKFWDLKFDWSNLFFACEHCNKTKGSKEIFNYILNCTNINHKVETWIAYEIKPFPKEKVQIEKLVDYFEDGQNLTKNTVLLLLQVYNGTTAQKTLEADNLRRALLNEIVKFQKFLFEYYDNASTNEEKKYALIQIKKHLSQESAFTAFKRWIIRKNAVFSKDFGVFFNA